MKPLGEAIQRLGPGCHQYVDETPLYLTADPKETLNWFLEVVLVCIRANKLKNNPEKTEVLLVSKSLIQDLRHHLFWMALFSP